MPWAATNLLTLPDYAVIAAYLALTLVIGLVVGRRLKTGADFFLAGRQLPWWAVGLSLVATDIGGTDIIGVGGAAHRHGLAVANFEWIGCVPAMIVGAFVFIPFFHRIGVTTVPEYLEHRYNAAVRCLLAGCWLLFMACNLGLMLLASAKLASALFGWDEATCIVGTAVLVGAYTTAGGLAAVVYTDTLQCVVMILGCLAIVVLGLVEVGGLGELQRRVADIERTEQLAATSPDDAAAADHPSGPTAAHPADSSPAAAPVQRLSLLLPVDTKSPFPWPGIYFGLAMILSPAYWIGNQAIVQRSLGARSEFEAKAAYVWGAVLKNIIPIIIAVPGLIAMVLLPDLSDSDQAIPSLVGRLLPAGLRGLFVAAFLAAMMSSVDSYLNSAATILSHDLYKRFLRRDVSDERLLQVGRLTTVALMVWAVGLAFGLRLLSDRSGIYAIFQTMMAFFQGPALAILLLGFFWRRANGAGALVGLLAGLATSIALYVLNQPAVYQSLHWRPLFQIQEPFLYFSIWAFLVAAVTTIAVSAATRPSSDDKLRYLIAAAPRSRISVASGMTGEILPATTLRPIVKGERVDDLIRELAHLTHESGGLEHAIISLGAGSREIVRGGLGGIQFADDLRRVLLHTHPTTTGPSPADFQMLEQLGQRHSYIWGLFGGGLSRFDRCGNDMAQFIPGKTLCAICGEPIATAADAIGFPAFVPRGHEFERYSDSVFHRECYFDWDRHSQFQNLFDEYERIWKSRPNGLSFDEMEQWGKTAFEQLFAQGITKSA